MATMRLLTLSNQKTMKGEAYGYLTAVLHLAPGALSGHQVCPSASEGCLASCLNTAGRAGIIKKGETTNQIQQARIRKTRALFADREAFMADLVRDLEALVRKAGREGKAPAARLNGTSDLPWEKYRAVRRGVEYRNLFQAFPEIQFYDYTKIAARALKAASGAYPANYRVTFSASECNQGAVELVARAGGNVAVVFDTVPDTYLGVPVIDGDKSDLRFLDPERVIVGLKAKGPAKRDTSGFVRRPVQGFPVIQVAA